MTDHGCWKSEYDWQVSRRSDAQSKQTVLSVLFDNGAQRRFSSVRVSLLHGEDTTTEHHAAWQITPSPSPLSVVDHPFLQDKPLQNDPSLPICHIVFVADRHSARSQGIDVEVAGLCGEIVLSEPSVVSSSTLFEFDQALTEVTQSVSVSFVSSHHLSTAIPHGIFSDPLSDQPATVGRVVRIIPTNERKSIFLPTDVLLVVFESLRSPLSYRGWRRDLISCALVCREWTCALSLLLIDFRSPGSQEGHPPEIVSFANAIIACPSLGLDIKCLSAGYLEKHPTWDPFPALPGGTPSSMFLPKLRLQQNISHRSQFAKTFLSILQAAKNIHTLYLDASLPLVVSSSDLAHTLSELTKLDTLLSMCKYSMAQLLCCIAVCPSLTCLSILGVTSPNTRGPPSHPSLPCHLTELTLTNVPVKDDELACLVSASSTTLERLTLDGISELTNAGFGAALTTVCRSLTHLLVVPLDPLWRAEGEEHALDVTIARMERLVELWIVPGLVSERMLARRAEAFVHQCSRGTVLPEIRLDFVGYDGVWESGLLGTVKRDWPGWEIH